MYKRAYIEITNICNMNCSFCIGTKREKAFMSAENFRIIAEKVRRETEYVYLHVMGEPLLHPQLDEILLICNDLGFKVNITTNGTLLGEKSDILLGSGSLRKVSVSLHSFEGNGYSDLEAYLSPICDFCKSSDRITELRLWNEGGTNSENERIIDFLSKSFAVDIRALPEKNNMRRIKDKTYLCNGEKFHWPSLDAPERNARRCYGLLTQFGVLCDGTVVPCCLDSAGAIPLGNAISGDLSEILRSDRAEQMRKGFAMGKPSEELCRKCGFAERFTK